MSKPLDKKRRPRCPERLGPLFSAPADDALLSWTAECQPPEPIVAPRTPPQLVERVVAAQLRDVNPLHLALDTAKWEQQAAFYINGHRVVEAFVKNAGMDFTIPYLNNGQDHEYVPDFIIRLKGEPGRYLILETKGYDELMEVKRAAAERWVAAVNADGRYGRWQYRLATKVADVPQILEEMAVASQAA